MRVILDGRGDLLMQARVAQSALASGVPEPVHGMRWRMYETEEPEPRRFTVRWNKASITVEQSGSLAAKGTG